MCRIGSYRAEPICLKKQTEISVLKDKDYNFIGPILIGAKSELDVIGLWADIDT